MNPYIVITPARNEAGNLPATIQSMADQVHRPAAWVVVNDGSTDGTGEILDEAATEYPWIKVLHRKDRGWRQQGGGVVEAFEDGLSLVRDEPWEFLVKLDADLSFPPDYFARCLSKFSEEPKLGIGGGVISHEVAGRLVAESPRDPLFHVRGATKIYRRACWEGIGRLVRAPGWDTIDELKANMLGWKTYTFLDVPLHHHRLTGSVDGTWSNLVKFGLSNYITGYHPLFMFLKCLKRAANRPYILGSVALWWGFVKGYFQAVQQVEDKELIRYVRRQQMNKILLRPSLW